jgi:hypothetical protein
VAVQIEITLFVLVQRWGLSVMQSDCSEMCLNSSKKGLAPVVLLSNLVILDL